MEALRITPRIWRKTWI